MSEMNKKSIFLIASVLAVAAVLAVGFSFAWFIYFKNYVIVVTGDTEISVTGKYQIASAGEVDDDKWLNFDFNDDANPFEEISAIQNIFFKFEIENRNKEKNVSVSVRFSDLTSNIFAKFDKTTTLDAGEIPLSKRSDIIAESAKNTGKLTYVIDNVHYIEKIVEIGGDGNPVIGGDGKPVIIDNDVPVYGSGLFDPHDSGYGTIPDAKKQGKYVWKNADSSRFINGQLEEERVKIAPEQSITLYFEMRNNPSQDVLNEYKEWLCGDDSATVSFGQKKCAELLGKTWGSTNSTEKAYINAYLEFFEGQERASISASEDDEMSMLSLLIDYIEFIGENADRPESLEII